MLSECPSKVGSADFDLTLHNVTLTSSTKTHLMLNATFACRGKLHQWVYFRTHHTPPIYASVWRHEELPQGYFRLVGKNELPPGGIGMQTVMVKDEDQIQVQPGDFIGFFYSNTVFKYSDPGAIAVVNDNTTGYRTVMAGYFDENFHIDMPHTFHTNDRKEELLRPAIEAHVLYPEENGEEIDFVC